MATDTTSQTVFQREAPEIEAYKLGLMEQAKNLTGTEPTGGLPAVQVAGADPLQTQAANLATQGVGSYQPFLTSGQQAITSGIGALSTAQPTAFNFLQGAPTLAAQGAQTFDPNMVTQFMDPYQQQVTDKALDLLQQRLDAEAIQQGAFTGNRAALRAGDVSASRILEDYSKNFQQAHQAAQNAFQNQQPRQQAAAQLQLAAGQGIGNLGSQAAQTLGTLGVQQAGLGELGTKLGTQDLTNLANLGQTQRGIAQQQLDAARQTNLQDIYEPYQRLSFYSDILRGAPSTQQTLSVSTAPSPSLLNQVVGGGIAGLGLAGAANKAGII